MALKINLAKSAGFCFGVKRAINIALETAGSGKEIYMLGDIVHNEDVVNKVSAVGIKKIRKLSSKSNQILLIPAHGIPEKTMRRAQSLGYNIIDATCPMVKEIHRTAKEAEEKCYAVIVIGDKKHDEVKGIVGQLRNRAVVIDTIKSMPKRKLRIIKKAAVVVQSTQNIENVSAIVEKLKAYIPDVVFHNTICLPTRIKQQEIRQMPRENDVMLVIGSKTSANTKRLFEISKSINKRSYWIQSKKDIKPSWLRCACSVGIAAGASTPEETMRDVISHIGKITA